MTEFKYCHDCGTKNKQNAAFCKNCGTNIDELPSLSPAEEVYNEVVQPLASGTVAETPTEPVTETSTETANSVESDYAESFTDEDVNLYLGDGSEKIFKKYKRFTEGKSAWNWPLFFYSLLGIPFVWFFYRKMYKAGAVVLAILVALSISFAAFSYLTCDAASENVIAFANASVDVIENEFHIMANSDRTALLNQKFAREFNNMLADLLNNLPFLTYFSLTSVVVALQAVFVFMLPAKANKLYFKKLTADLTRLKAQKADEKAIRAAGGVNITTAVVSGFLISALIKYACSIPMGIFFNSFFMELLEVALHFISNFGIKIKW